MPLKRRSWNGVIGYTAVCVLLLRAAGFGGDLAAVNERAQSTEAQEAIVALFQHTPATSTELSRTPLLAIYGDGRVIMRRTQDGNGQPTTPTYWSGRLTIEQRIELNIRQAALLRDPDLKDHYDVSARANRPTTTFVFTKGDRVFSIAAEGLFASEFDVGREEQGTEQLPASLTAYHRFLITLLFDAETFSPWKPDAYVARLYRVRPQPRAGKWPTKWPAPLSTDLRLNEGNVEIVLPISSPDIFWSAMPGTAGRVVAYGGKFWKVECFPYVPGHEKWFAELAGTEEWFGDLDPYCLCSIGIIQVQGWRERAAVLWDRPRQSGVSRAISPLTVPVSFPIGALPEILLPGQSQR